MPQDRNIKGGFPGIRDGGGRTRRRGGHSSRRGPVQRAQPPQQKQQQRQQRVQPKDQMKTIFEKSVGAVIFRRAKFGSRDAVLYLILHYHQNDDYWEFPRGGMEAGESEMQTALREIREETGLKQADLRFVPGFRAAIHYWYVLKGTRRSKDAVYFLAETKNDSVMLSPEHLGFTWAEYDDAMKLFKFDNARNVLKQARDFLSGSKAS